MKKLYMLFLCGALLVGCSKQEDTTIDEPVQTSSIVSYDEYDLDSDYSDETVQNVSLNEDSISFDGTGASVSGSTITITKAGTYKFSGTLNDGAIIVDSTTEALIRIVLNDATINCSTSAPIYVKQADKVLLTLAKGTTNTVSDGSDYVFSDATSEEPNATIFSKDDLTINGSGSLIVTANYNNGIQSKDDLKIVSGTIDVTSTDDAFVGKDVLAIRSADITIQANGDGLKTTNTEDSSKGNVAIEGGTLQITAQTDGIQSANGLYIYDGDITIQSGGGSVNSSKQTTMTNGKAWGNWDNSATTSDEETSSAKGLKSQTVLEISNGTLNLDTSDDSIHTNGTLQISNGTITLSSGDDGIHADTSLLISGGIIDILQSYEGIESSELTFSGGTIHVKASDDGLNAGGGNDASSTDGRAGQNQFSSDTSKIITFEDGYLYVDAGGDGLDSNGNIVMNGGTILVEGPTDGANGSLDFGGEFFIAGGYLIAVGSSSMLQSPTSISNGSCVSIGFNTSLSSLVHIQDSNGNDVMTFQPSKTIQSLILYTSQLTNGSTYEIYTDGNASGTSVDGLYTNSAYTGGTLYESFTIASSNTTVGSSQGMMGGGMQPGGKQQGGGGPQDMQPQQPK